MQGKMEINGVELNYQIDGPEGAPGVVMSNSWATDYTMWDANMEALTAKYRVLRMDKRGHGGSGINDDEITLEVLADDVVGLAEALGFTKGHFVGLSIGGMIGQAIGLNHPDAFKSLALCATTSLMPEQMGPVWQERIDKATANGVPSMVPEHLERWFSSAYREANPAVAEALGKVVAATSLEGYCRCAQAIMKLNFTDRLGGITTPTIVMPGELDGALPPPMSEVIANKIPGARLPVVSNAAHLCNVENTMEFNEVLIEFLDEQSA